MSRITQAFDRAKKEGRAALVVYECAGDPSLEHTPALLIAAAEAGADVLEVGMPFSDPTADGVAIQEASERALRAGATLAKTLAAIGVARQKISTPIVLFGYYNPILAYGEEKLVRDAKAAGVDGFLVVDLPPEEAQPFVRHIKTAGLDYVPLIAPTTTPLRFEQALSVATSFLYYVSMTGVTGSQRLDTREVRESIVALKQKTALPIAVGFGVKTPHDVQTLAGFADAVVVGSAVVQTIAQASTPRDAVHHVHAFVSSLRSATWRTDER